MEKRVSVKTRMARESGYTGLSCLHRLHSLYGFDACRDLVFDVMHNLPLNVVKHHLKCLLDLDCVQHAEVEKIFKLMQVAICISYSMHTYRFMFPHPAFSTSELRDGRLPTEVTSRLGFWKAEELQKFGFPAAECVLAGLVSDDEHQIWWLLSRIMELIFSTGRNGFTEEEIRLQDSLVKRHNILVAESHGIFHYVVTLHNLEHISEDIVRFSSPDNFWCYSYERAVDRYTGYSSNCKNIEHSFAKAECR